MKKAIHPTYFSESKAKCVCGASFTVGSTQKELNLEICSQCHPFYTGNAKMMDTAGRVEKFKARKAAASPKKGK
ncbi:MAG: 50S ribosomal protein L31 [Candidatus Parcubacteria bacterium]|nr:50S ribosomal protein L31 [Candidatus Parcubacteria bacterium]